MTKRFVRIKAPPEFNDWIEKRIEKMTRLVKQSSRGNLKRLSKMKAMKIISETDGVNIPEDLFKKLKRFMTGAKKC